MREEQVGSWQCDHGTSNEYTKHAVGFHTESKFQMCSLDLVKFWLGRSN